MHPLECLTNSRGARRGDLLDFFSACEGSLFCHVWEYCVFSGLWLKSVQAQWTALWGCLEQANLVASSRLMDSFSVVAIYLVSEISSLTISSSTRTGTWNFQTSDCVNHWIAAHCQPCMRMSWPLVKSYGNLWMWKDDRLLWKDLGEASRNSCNIGRGIGGCW